MKITVEVEADITSDSGYAPTEKDLVSAVAGIRNALLHAQGEGFSHPRDIEVSIEILSVKLTREEINSPLPAELERLACHQCKGAGCPKCHESGWLG